MADIKKGKPTWKPAQRLDIRAKSKDFRYRWCDRDEQNLEKKLAEGWVFADSIHGVKAEHVHPEGVSDGKPLTNQKTYRELVAMVLPEEMGQARDEYVAEQTRKGTEGIKKVLQEDITNEAKDRGIDGARVHGKIVIE